MFSPTVTVTADIHLVSFLKKDKQWDCAPFLYFTQDQPPRIHSIGEHPTDRSSLQYIHLFEEPISTFDYSEVLAAFMRHGVFSVSGKGTMIRPKIHVIITSSLSIYLRGFSSIIFSRAAFEAGATSVTVERRA
jgi:hypothetical protein